ncbi:MAG: DUF1501 domain-containing protein [Myxococcota bacterium]
MFSRRSLLRMSATALATAPLAPTARAVTSARNLVVVFAFGGWDTTAVFDPKPGADAVDTPAGSWADFGALALWRATDLGADGRAYLNQHAPRMAVVNGVAVNSLVHEAALQIVLSGQVGDHHPPDVGARIAAALGADRPLPYLTTGSSARPRELAAQAGTVGYSNQLFSLLSPDYAWPGPDGGAAPGFQPDPTVQAAVDAYLTTAHGTLDRVRTSPGRNAQKLADWMESHERAGRIRQHTAAGGLFADPDLFADLAPWRRAARALSEGFSRAVFVQDEGYWDTHGGNAQQPGLFTNLFRGLGQLLDELESAGIRDETLVLVLSEMGRSPLLNAQQGKDHWPFTSAMLVGADVRPGVVRGTDASLVQRRVSLASGEPDPEGHALTAADVLATTAHLMGADAAALYPEGEVIRAIVA